MRMRLDSLLNVFSKQTQIDFSFNSNQINPGKIIFIRNKKQTLKEWLSFLQQDMGIHYTLLGDHIILVNVHPVSVKRRSSSPKRYSVKTFNKPRITRSLDNKIGTKSSSLLLENGHIQRELHAQKPDPNDTTGAALFLSKNYLPGDSLGAAKTRRTTDEAPGAIMNNHKMSGDTSEVSTASARKQKDIISEGNLLLEKQRLQSTGNGSLLFMKTGISSSDVFYFSPALEIRYRFLYGHLSWNTNFSVSGFRYGLGISARIREGLRLNMLLTFGTLSKYFVVDTFQRVLSKNKLTSFDFLFEKKLADKWSLQLGPVINYLSIHYYKDNQPYAFGNPVKSSEKQYYIIKPAYFLVNSYTSGSVANLKVWVGLQVGLRYNISL